MVIDLVVTPVDDDDDDSLSLMSFLTASRGVSKTRPLTKNSKTPSSGISQSSTDAKKAS